MWTDSAELALTTRNKPLFLELVLDFSCFVKKKLRFTEEMIREDITMVNDRLGIHFHSVLSGHCATDPSGQSAPPKALESGKLVNHTPKWVRIDYKNGNWIGEFGS